MKTPYALWKTTDTHKPSSRTKNMPWNLFSGPSKLFLELDIVIFFFVCGKTYTVILSVCIVSHRILLLDQNLSYTTKDQNPKYLH